MKHLAQRARHIVSNQGILAYLSHLKQCFYHKPLLDESWYRLNYLARPSHRFVAEIQGSKMNLDLADPGINRDLFLHRVREPESTKIYQSELEEGMHIADVGANVGYYVLMETRFIGSSGKVYAIEPAPRNFELLVENVKLNGCEDRVELHNLAASDGDGSLSFYLGDSFNHHRLSVESDDPAHCIEVKAMRLDDLLEGKRVDVVRMDPEGAEWVIFQGMEKMLAAGDPMKIFLEVHPQLITNFGGTMEEFYRILSDAGFQLNYYVEWVPDSHYTIPYIKGKEPEEKVFEYRRPLKELLQDPEVAGKLLCKSGHHFEAGYKIFLDR